MKIAKLLQIHEIQGSKNFLLLSMVLLLGFHSRTISVVYTVNIALSNKFHSDLSAWKTALLVLFIQHYLASLK